MERVDYCCLNYYALNVVLNINTKAVVVLANKLEKLRKSAFPNAVRNTLNSAAFDVKQKTMPVSASKHFVKRKPNFFKANSKVVMAQGYDIDSMRSTIGFTPTNAEYNNYAVKELQQQEFSGSIPHRTFVPLNASRSGNNYGGQVTPSNRLKAVNNIVDASKMVGRNKKEQFVRAAIKAGKRGFVITNLGKQKVVRINTISRDKNNRTVIGKTAIYSYDHGRSVRIKKATHFMREASYNTTRKMNGFFSREANKQFQRVFR